MKIYSELLKIGSQPASSLSRLIKIPRTSAQFTAETLVKKGFLKKFIKNKTTYYLAEKLDKLKSIIDTKTELYNQKANEQKQYLNEAEKLFKTTHQANNNQSKVIFYEGVDNVISSYMEFIDSIPPEETIYNYVSPAESNYEGFRSGMREFIKKRINKKIFSNTICSYCESGVKLKITDKNSYRKTLISYRKTSDKFLSNEIIISSNKILSASLTPQGLFSSLTYDKNIAEMQIAIFQMAWEQAKVENEEIRKSKKYNKIMVKFKNIKDYN